MSEDCRQRTDDPSSPVGFAAASRRQRLLNSEVGMRKAEFSCIGYGVQRIEDKGQKTNLPPKGAKITGSY